MASPAAGLQPATLSQKKTQTVLCVLDIRDGQPRLPLKTDIFGERRGLPPNLPSPLIFVSASPPHRQTFLEGRRGSKHKPTKAGILGRLSVQVYARAPHVCAQLLEELEGPPSRAQCVREAQDAALLAREGMKVPEWSRFPVADFRAPQPGGGVDSGICMSLGPDQRTKTQKSLRPIFRRLNFGVSGE